MPFSVDNFDCDQAGQALLLAASIQGGELCADSDSRSRYWVFDVGPRAWDVSSNGLEVVFDSAVARLVCSLTVVSFVLA